MQAETKRDNPHLKRFYYTQDVAIQKPFNWKQLLRLLQYIKPDRKSVV